MLQRRNALDRRIQAFHDRWETNRQFRATMSAGLAVVMLLSLCSCMLVTATVTNRVFGTVAGTNGGNNPPDNLAANASTGGPKLQGAESFPTATVIYSVGPSPQPQPIPTSSTPEPTATPVPTSTPVPTATPCQANCGGGGGGKHATISVAGWSSRSTWVPNGGVSITVHSSVSGDAVNYIVTFASGLTMLSYAGYPNGVPTDGNGNAVYAFNVPGAACSSNSIVVQVSVSSMYGGSSAANIPCGP